MNKAPDHCSIEFLSIGQGDSLLISWVNPQNKIVYGVVDCCISNHGGKARTVKELEKRKVNHLEFAVLSHPHSDHYSGFIDLFDYLIKNNGVIGTFIHTCSFDPRSQEGAYELATANSQQVNKTLVDSLKSAESDQSLKEDLINLLKIINSHEIEGKIKKNRLINTVVPILESKTIPVDKHLQLNFYAPTFKDEHIRYRASLSSEPNQAASKANLLSTIFEISYKGNGGVILTSDAMSSSLNKIEERRIDNSIPIKVSQVAHHGSDGNFARRYWRNITSRENNGWAIVSCGPGSPHHPGKEVMNFFESNSWNCFLTSEGKESFQRDISNHGWSSNIVRLANNIFQVSNNIGNQDVRITMKEGEIDVRRKVP